MRRSVLSYVEGDRRVRRPIPATAAEFAAEVLRHGLDVEPGHNGACYCEGPRQCLWVLRTIAKAVAAPAQPEGGER